MRSEFHTTPLIIIVIAFITNSLSITNKEMFNRNYYTPCHIFLVNRNILWNGSCFLIRSKSTIAKLHSQISHIDNPVYSPPDPFKYYPNEYNSGFNSNKAPYHGRFNKYDHGHRIPYYQRRQSRPYNTINNYQRQNNSAYGQFGNRLQKIQWNDYDLVEIKKDFYNLSKEADTRSAEDIETLLADNSILMDGQPPLPKPVNSFDEAVFNPVIQQLLKSSGFQEPTPIQKVGWTSCLTGRDVIGISQTGSGKTLTFLLPGLLHILAQPPLSPGEGPIMLVLTPTRELCIQISEESAKFVKTLNLRGATIYGGVSRYPQLQQLQRGAEIIVATPGRLVDFLETNNTNLRRVSYLVLDEADRMLDMGFENQIRNILSQVRPDKQIVMFTATWPKDIKMLASEFCANNTIYIQVGDRELSVNPRITQHVKVINSSESKSAVLDYLEKHRDKKILIFCDFKRLCDQMCQELRFRNFKALSLHGDKSQTERERVLNMFKNGNCDVLIATDVAARGLDVKDINVIINMDMPKRTSDYIHRIGRTARGEKTGESMLFFVYDYLDPLKCKLASEVVEILERGNQEIPQELLDIAKCKK
ncbi:DEAD/DEAH box helicase [Babesia microti strain RI]|uniref:RNA helicase n=1 Tax=Babesia microti (strain RI) TaxID=1133968 RepID=A0A1N6LWJ2_BABMR|nr:DEAD/DEAH box helicase [Babesia microti strain RI]SIO73242.1 DEAD/DEAH box helicase [Babesia microti strain RI]|eukprot:XP_021337349.1 DEAD/DEAH box helicase [Babesia microti strain RI]